MAFAFSEIQMIVEMNSFVEFINEDDDTTFENQDFQHLRQSLDIDMDICAIHHTYYSNGQVGYNGNMMVYFSNQRKDTFLLLDLASEADGLDLVRLVIRYQKEKKNKIKSLARLFYDRTAFDTFYQEGMTIERNSQILTDLSKYPKKKNNVDPEYLQDIEFYQKGAKLETNIDLTELYVWPFTKEE